MTIADALRATDIDAREARLLLAAAAGFSEASVIAHPERALPPAIGRRFAEFVDRRTRGEPVAYILGRKEFYGLELAVTPAVLIPRPETELLVDLALEREAATIADLGTGSGAVALALKRRRPEARIVAVDSSAAALEVAKRNSVRLNLEIELRHGRWCEPLGCERFDLIVANPPYVAQGDPHLDDLRYEPASALISGPDGLDALRAIAAEAAAHVERGGWLFVEHGMGQDAAVRRLLERGGLEEVRSWPDLAGIPRVSGGRR